MDHTNLQRGTRNVRLVIVLVFLIPILLSLLPNLITEIFTKFDFFNNFEVLDSPIWWAFWGSYIGGIATLLAVNLTIQQTSDHFNQNEKSQVKPLLIFSERRYMGTTISFLGYEETEPEPHWVPMDLAELNEIDTGNILISFKKDIRVDFRDLTEEEKSIIVHRGLIQKKKDNTTCTTAKYRTALMVFDLINVGKGPAINCYVFLKQIQPEEMVYDLAQFNLLENDKKTLRFLLIKEENECKQFSKKFVLSLQYHDIYGNEFVQDNKLDVQCSDLEKPLIKFDVFI